MSRSSSTCRILSHLLPPHLHLTIPAGVRLPQAVEAAGREAVDDGTQVLVIGRFARAAAGCARAPWGCGETFVVERFAWADGVRVGLTPLIAEPLQTGTKRGEPLRHGPRRVGAAAGRRRSPGPTASPAWTLTPPLSQRPGPRVSRSGTCGCSRMRPSPGSDRLVRWMLLADRDFRVIGSGRVPATTADAAGLGPG